MHNIQNLVIAFCGAFVVSVILTPKIRDFLNAIQLGDKPDGIRKIHTVMIPNLGGIAIFCGFVLGLILMSALSIDFYVYISLEFIWFLLGIGIIIITGIIDDIYGLSHRIKFIAQISAALLVVLMDNLTVNSIKEPFSGRIFFISQQIGILFSVFWIVAVSNIINQLDGMDGLAAGISVIASVVMGTISLVNGDYFIATIYFVLIGSTLGFLRYNFNPASIFMGDTGALFLGYVLGYLTLRYRPSIDSSFMMIVPILALLVPIVDTFLKPVRRGLEMKNMFLADKDHIHHRTMERFNLSHKGTVLSLYLISIVFGCVSLVVALMPEKIYITGAFIFTNIAVVAYLYQLGYVTDMYRNTKKLFKTYREKYLQKEDA